MSVKLELYRVFKEVAEVGNITPRHRHCISPSRR